MHLRIQIDFQLGQPGIAYAVIGQRNRWIDGPINGGALDPAFPVHALIISQRQIAARPEHFCSGSYSFMKRVVLDGVQGIVVYKILDRPLGWQPMRDMFYNRIQVKLKILDCFIGVFQNQLGNVTISHVVIF